MGNGSWLVWWGCSVVLRYDMSWLHYGFVILGRCFGLAWASLFGVGAYCSDRLGLISTFVLYGFLHLNASTLDLGSVTIMNDYG